MPLKLYLVQEDFPSHEDRPNNAPGLSLCPMFCVLVLAGLSLLVGVSPSEDWASWRAGYMSDSPLYSTAQHSRMIKKKQNSRQPLTRSSHLTEVTTKYTHRPEPSEDQEVEG